MKESLILSLSPIKFSVLARQFEKIGDDPNMGTIFRKRKREYKVLNNFQIAI